MYGCVVCQGFEHESAAVVEAHMRSCYRALQLWLLMNAPERVNTEWLANVSA